MLAPTHLQILELQAEHRPRLETPSFLVFRVDWVVQGLAEADQASGERVRLALGQDSLEDGVEIETRARVAGWD